MKTLTEMKMRWDEALTENEMISLSAGLHTEVAQMVREKWRSLMAGCMSTNYIPDKRLGQLLREWGGDEDDILDPKFGKGQHPDDEKVLRVLGEEMTAEELKLVLQVGPKLCWIYPSESFLNLKLLLDYNNSPSSSYFPGGSRPRGST